MVKNHLAETGHLVTGDTIMIGYERGIAKKVQSSSRMERGWVCERITTWTQEHFVKHLTVKTGCVKCSSIQITITCKQCPDFL